MYKDYYEVHSAEYEELMQLLSEDHELTDEELMDLDYEWSGGHLWD